MNRLDWFEVFPPKPLTLAQVTALLRPLAGRGRSKLFKPMPLVLFETWLERDRVRWFIGVDRQLTRALPHQLASQLPGLSLVERPGLARKPVKAAYTIRPSSVSFPLRLDTAEAVASALLPLAGELSAHERIVVQWVVGPSAARHKPPAEFHWQEALGIRPPIRPDAQMNQAWRAKVSEPLFGVQGRIGVATRHASRTIGLLKEAADALSLLNSPHTHLVTGPVSRVTARRLVEVTGSGRTWTGIVNAAELAALLGYPLGDVAVPGRPGASFGRAPTKLLMPNGAPPTDGSRVLGVSQHPADGGQLVRMPVSASTHHLHIIGPTGSGKSHAMTQLILADAEAGHGLLVLEPKGDLVNDVLRQLPPHRHADVVLIEPGETGAVVGLNPLAGQIAEAERRADELLHLFRELFGTSVGPRSSDVLLHALITAARLPDGTLADVPVLLTNPVFRRQALTRVNDPLVLAPYWAWYDQLSDGERAHVVAPLLNKLRVFTSRTALRRLLGQAQPRFDLAELFTRRRIVLVNLNRGLIGPQTARLLGSLLLNQLWLEIQRRAAVPAQQRRPVMVHVDEWQDYTAALDFGDVLAQARGLGVGFTLAHQHLQQLSPELRAAVLANARSRLAFRPAQKDAKTLAAVLGQVTPDDLERLEAFRAAARLLVDAELSPLFAIRSRPLPAPSNDIALLRRHAQERYGVAGDDLDAALTDRWQGTSATTDAPVGITKRRRP